MRTVTSKSERRSSRRRECSGEVRLFRNGPGVSQVRGSLSDISDEGFRMTHHCMELGAGEKIKFSHPYGQGWAIVIWTRVAGENVETGFLLTRDREKPKN